MLPGQWELLKKGFDSEKKIQSIRKCPKWKGYWKTRIMNNNVFKCKIYRDICVSIQHHDEKK